MPRGVRHPVLDALDALPRPRLGYLGNLAAYKIDLELIYEIARQRPQWSVVLVGPTNLGDTRRAVTEAEAPPNVHWLGEVPHAVAPAVIDRFDVALLPSARHDVMQASFPLKFFEYLLRGKAGGGAAAAGAGAVPGVARSGGRCRGVRRGGGAAAGGAGRAGRRGGARSRRGSGGRSGWSGSRRCGLSWCGRLVMAPRVEHPVCAVYFRWGANRPKIVRNGTTRRPRPSTWPAARPSMIQQAADQEYERALFDAVQARLRSPEDYVRYQMLVAEPLLRRMRPFLADGPVHLLEVGCGTGGVSLYLASQGFRVAAVDRQQYDSDALPAARRFAVTHKIGLNLAQADAAALPFDPDSFDCVVCSNVVEHLDDPDGALGEIHRVLKPGGLAFVDFPLFRSTYGRPHRGLGQDSPGFICSRTRGSWPSCDGEVPSATWPCT